MNVNHPNRAGARGCGKLVATVRGNVRTTRDRTRPNRTKTKTEKDTREKRRGERSSSSRARANNTVVLERATLRIEIELSIEQ